MGNLTAPRISLRCETRCRWTTLLRGGVVLAAFLPAVVVRASEAEVAQGTADEQRAISEMIEQLGADEPILRERAEAELTERGMMAFEMLEAASNHEDIEIRVRVMRILDKLRKLAVNQEVHEALELYLRDLSAMEPERRATLLGIALQAEPVLAVPIACQTARLDKSALVSKVTAARLVNQVVSGDADELLSRQSTILKGVGPSNRPPCRWLRSYALSLTDPAAQLADYRQLIDEERRRMKFERDANVLVLNELLPLSHLDMLLRAKKEPEFVAGLAEFTESQLDKRDVLWRLGEWLIARDRPRQYVELAEQFRDVFYEDRLLRYRVAQAMEKAGDAAAAEKLAEETRAWDEAPADHPTANDALQQLGEASRVAEQPSWLAYYTANELHEGGMVAWGDRELYSALDREKSERAEAAEDFIFEYFVRLSLAESRHDQGDHAGAATVYEKLGRAFEEKETGLFEQLSERGPETASRWRYFRARAKLKEGDVAGARQELEQGIANAYHDSDVLIAMYRLPDQDEAWKTLTRQQMQRAIAHYKSEIRNAQLAARSVGNVYNPEVDTELLQNMNQYAWLVGNTEGNTEEAIRLSRDSLQGNPRGSQLDTLGRCYYAAGDLENALRYQRQAVRLEPHSSQLRRQLEFFESESQAARESQN